MNAVVPNKTGKSPNDLIVAVLGYLNVNYARTTMAETAAFFGYSPPYMSRLIHVNTGKTYNQIITELQVERAITLMQEGERNITKIAQDVGCFDSSHFHKKFKSVYGISPKVYLEKFVHPGEADPAAFPAGATLPLPAPPEAP